MEPVTTPAEASSWSTLNPVFFIWLTRSENRGKWSCFTETDKLTFAITTSQSNLRGSGLPRRREQWLDADLRRLDDSRAHIAHGDGQVPGMLNHQRPERESASVGLGFGQQSGDSRHVRGRHTRAADGVIESWTRPTGAHIYAWRRNIHLPSIGIQAAIRKERNLNFRIQRSDRQN